MSLIANNFKYIHLMSNDKFGKPFVDFLNKNFDSCEHLVLCKRFFTEFPFPEGENVLEIKSYKEFPLNAPHIEKIICHSLFDEERVHYLYNNKKILQEKAYWQIWGGDLSDAPRDAMNDYVRTHFKGYITAFDEEEAKKKYNMKGEFYYAFYSNPLASVNLKKISEEREAHTGIHIQINNSADPTILEVLDMLKKFRAKDILISVILSYGQKKFNTAILEKGKGIFGKKFQALTEFLPPEEYAKHLAKQDILILNQNRQQGGANIHHCIHLGAKIFIKKNISRSIVMKEHNIAIYDTEDIADMSFEDFINNTTAEQNRQNIKNMYTSKGRNTELWQKFFDA